MQESIYSGKDKIITPTSTSNDLNSFNTEIMNQYVIAKNKMELMQKQGKEVSDVYYLLNTYDSSKTKQFAWWWRLLVKFIAETEKNTLKAKWFISSYRNFCHVVLTYFLPDYSLYNQILAYQKDNEISLTLQWLANDAHKDAMLQKIAATFDKQMKQLELSTINQESLTKLIAQLKATHGEKKGLSQFSLTNKDSLIYKKIIENDIIAVPHNYSETIKTAFGLNHLLPPNEINTSAEPETISTLKLGERVEEEQKDNLQTIVDEKAKTEFEELLKELTKEKKTGKTQNQGKKKKKKRTQGKQNENDFSLIQTQQQAQVTLNTKDNTIQTPHQKQDTKLEEPDQPTEKNVIQNPHIISNKILQSTNINSTSIMPLVHPKSEENVLQEALNDDLETSSSKTTIESFLEKTQKIGENLEKGLTINTIITEPSKTKISQLFEEMGTNCVQAIKGLNNRFEALEKGNEELKKGYEELKIKSDEFEKFKNSCVNRKVIKLFLKSFYEQHKDQLAYYYVYTNNKEPKNLRVRLATKSVNFNKTKEIDNTTFEQLLTDLYEEKTKYNNIVHLQPNAQKTDDNLSLSYREIKQRIKSSAFPLLVSQSDDEKLSIDCYEDNKFDLNTVIIKNINQATKEGIYFKSN